MEFRKFQNALLIVILLFPFSSAHATININVDAVQKSVVFLYSATPTGSVDPTKPLGTAFLVEVPLKSDATRAYKFLVTARHIFDPRWTQCSSENPSLIYARVNKKGEEDKPDSSRIEFVPIPLFSGGQQKWSHHDDEEVDAAIIPFTTDNDKLDVVSVPVALFPTDAEAASQSIGDPIMSAGLLPRLPGNTRNYPIFKFGQISNIPSESIAIDCPAQRAGVSLKVWLIAANLVPGNSGSPVFHVPLGGSGVSFGGTRPMILGIQSISFLGADVAGMTPIKYVYEILEHLHLRDANLNRGLQSAAPNPQK